jgi:hypothetical protein
MTVARVKAQYLSRDALDKHDAAVGRAMGRELKKLLAERDARIEQLESRIAALESGAPAPSPRGRLIANLLARMRGKR